MGFVCFRFCLLCSKVKSVEHCLRKLHQDVIHSSRNLETVCCSFYHYGFFRTIVFIFIFISTTFQSIGPPVYFRCLSNSGTYTELWTKSFIKSAGVTCPNSVNHNRITSVKNSCTVTHLQLSWTCNLQMIVAWETWEPTPTTVKLCPAGHIV